MSHPYPPHRSDLPYAGKFYYFLTFCTDQRKPFFTDPTIVSLVRTQFLRSARKHDYELTAYCFMPDHLHLIAHGITDESDLKAFVKAAKQHSGYAFKQLHDCRLWQRYGFERVIRDANELASTIGYVIANPIRAGLASHPADYPHLGSERYTVAELLQMCEYKQGRVYLPPKGGSHDLPPKGGSHDLPPKGGSHGNCRGAILNAEG